MSKTHLHITTYNRHTYISFTLITLPRNTISLPSTQQNATTARAMCHCQRFKCPLALYSRGPDVGRKSQALLVYSLLLPTDQKLSDCNFTRGNFIYSDVCSIECITMRSVDQYLHVLQADPSNGGGGSTALVSA